MVAARKQRIEDSRVHGDAAHCRGNRGRRRPPAVLVSGSGVGFYGPMRDEIVTEETGAGSDFLAGVCRRWEAQAVTASSAATRVVCIRTGLVLAHDGGALARMLLPFDSESADASDPGRQYWPWIHRQDWVELVRFVLRTPGAVGPINATAPAPVTNAAFTKEIGPRAPPADVAGDRGSPSALPWERWRTRCCSRDSARSRPGRPSWVSSSATHPSRLRSSAVLHHGT